MIRSVLGLLAADALLLPLGAGLLLATGTWDRLAPSVRIPVALFAGLAGFCAIVPPLLYAGLSPTPLVVVPISLVGLALGVLRRRRAARDPGGGELLAILALTPPFGLLAAEARVRPMDAFDAFADWTLKSIQLYGHGGALLGALDDRVFAGQAYRYVHPEYPIGQPALEAFQFHVMGRADTRVVHLHFVLLLAALLATVWALLRPRVPALALTAGLLAIALSPDLTTQLLSGYADLPVACFWTAAALSIGLWLDGDGDDRLVLGAVFCAAALATKQEGIVLDAVLLGGAAALLAVGRRGASLRRLGAVTAAVVATALPWQLSVHAHGVRDRDIDPSLSRMGDQTANVSLAAHRLAHELLKAHDLWVVPIAVGAAVVLLLRPGERRLGAGYLLLLLGVLAAFVLVYWNARTPARTLLSTSAHRVTVTPVLLSAAAAPLLLTRALAPRWGRQRSVPDLH